MNSTIDADTVQKNDVTGRSVTPNKSPRGVNFVQTIEMVTRCAIIIHYKSSNSHDILCQVYENTSWEWNETCPAVAYHSSFYDATNSSATSEAEANLL